MIVTRLDPKGRLALTTELLEALGVKPGDEVALRITEQSIAIEPVAVQDEDDDAIVQAAIDDFLARPRGPTSSVDEVMARINAHIDELARKPDAA